MEVSKRLDNRGLQPPEPMVRILDALPEIPPATYLEVLLDREPVFLFPELESRGFRWEGEVQADGAYQLRIWKP